MHPSIRDGVISILCIWLFLLIGDYLGLPNAVNILASITLIAGSIVCASTALIRWLMEFPDGKDGTGPGIAPGRTLENATKRYKAEKHENLRSQTDKERMYAAKLLRRQISRISDSGRVTLTKHLLALLEEREISLKTNMEAERSQTTEKTLETHNPDISDGEMVDLTKYLLTVLKARGL